MEGQVLGAYQLGAKISAGGMGVVYRATHVLIGKPAAVKLLLPEFSSNAEVVKRFFNEARAATAIRHPGIVDIFDFGYAPDGQAYIVMELLDGEVLSHRLRRLGAMPEYDAVTLIARIAGALGAAHNQGIVHRDLKPDNVFLVADPDVAEGERPKLLDFGIAKLIEPSAAAHTRTGIVIGTPTYMAPEQARGSGTVDHRADLYALGCILYELLCGRPPFVAEGAGEIIGAHLHVQPDPVRRWQPSVSPRVDAVVMRLLAKDPAHRQQTTAELLADLGHSPATNRPRRATDGALPQEQAPTTLSNPAAATPPPQEQAPTTLGHAAAAFSVHAPPPRRRWPIVLAAAAMTCTAVVLAVVAARGDGASDAPGSPATSAPATAAPVVAARADEPPAAAPTPPPSPVATPPATAPATPPAAEPVTDAAPALVTIQLAPLPTGAIVLLDGAPATPPLQLAAGETHALIVRLDGHIDFAHDLVVDHDRTIEVELVPTPTRRSAPSRRRRPAAPAAPATRPAPQILEETL